MALQPTVKARALAHNLDVADEPKRTAVEPHEIDGRYTRAAWNRPHELHQSRWTHGTREEYVRRARAAGPPAGTDYASGVAACLTHELGTPLIHRHVEGLVPGYGCVFGLRPPRDPAPPDTLDGGAFHRRPQLCQKRPHTVGDAGVVRDRALWTAAGLATNRTTPARPRQLSGAVLAFDVAFDHQPIDQPRALRIGAVLLYYLDDDSVQINLPLDPFADAAPNEYGERRGRVFLRRAPLLRADGSPALRLAELNVGANVTVHGRALDIVGCDPFTRSFLEDFYGGAERVPADGPLPLAAKAGRARTGNEARRGVGAELARADEVGPFGWHASRLLRTGGAAW